MFVCSRPNYNRQYSMGIPFSGLIPLKSVRAQTEVTTFAGSGHRKQCILVTKCKYMATDSLRNV